MRSPGIDVRPIRNALGDSHFCEVFLDDVEIPEANLVGPEHAGWQVAQATLSAERGMTMLELAERLAGGFRWLVDDVLTVAATAGPARSTTRSSAIGWPGLRPSSPGSGRCAGTWSSGPTPAWRDRPTRRS